MRKFNSPKFQRDAGPATVLPIPEPVLHPASSQPTEQSDSIDKADLDITEISEDLPTAQIPAPSDLNSSQLELGLETLVPSKSDHTDTAETSLSEHSLQPYDLAEASLTVSYTHLTLPTICSV